MPGETYGEIVRRMPPELVQRLPEPAPVQPDRVTEVHQHLHFHAAPVVPAAQEDPAKRSTHDDGVLAWFMPYFVVGMLALVLGACAVGVVLAVAVVVFGMIMGLVQAVAGMVFTVAIAAVCVILAMGEIRGKGKG